MGNMKRVNTGKSETLSKAKDQARRGGECIRGITKR
jgi:hypothetical protein